MGEATKDLICAVLAGNFRNIVKLETLVRRSFRFIVILKNTVQRKRDKYTLAAAILKEPYKVKSYISRKAIGLIAEIIEADIEADIEAAGG